MGFLFMAMRIMYRHRDTAKSKKGSLWYVKYVYDFNSVYN